jgi:hypothetical protein
LAAIAKTEWLFHHQMSAEDLVITEVAIHPAEGGQGANPPGMIMLDRPASTRHRKLHLGQFAFMRVVVQGLDTRDSWNRYLRIEGEHGDLRNVRRTIQWIRDEFAAAAKRHDHFGTARLVKVDASRIGQDEPGVPTLEAFAVEAGMEGFAQAEQLEHYHARYGTLLQRQARRSRLIARQLEALAWLERLVAQPPQAGDALAAWLHPDLVSGVN